MEIARTILLPLGLFQMVAVFYGFADTLQWPCFFAVLAGIILGWIPIIGTSIAIWAAVTAWDWSLLQAFSAFGIPCLLVIVCMRIRF